MLCLQVLDMVSPRHDQWQALNKKRQQVHQLAHTQQRVVSAALGCDDAAAAATLAALSAGQPVQGLLQGFISVSVRHGTTAAAVAGLSEAGTSPLEDSAAAPALIKDAQSLITELGFWEDGTAMLAWLLLRSGQLSTAAKVAEAQPNGFFQKQPAHGSKQWAWRWWVLAQVKWQQGELTEAKLFLQEGQQQLSKFAQATSNGNSSNGSSSASPSLWRLLLPSAQDLTELLQQVQQLLAFKEAGNAAISAKQFDKATEAYTKALALQPSCGFAAVIHSNRAAALQQQQRLIEALADCSRAVALDPKYAKAYLRWVPATLVAAQIRVYRVCSTICWPGVGCLTRLQLRSVVLCSRRPLEAQACKRVAPTIRLQHASRAETACAAVLLCCVAVVCTGWLKCWSPCTALTVPWWSCRTLSRAQQTQWTPQPPAATSSHTAQHCYSSALQTGASLKTCWGQHRYAAQRMHLILMSVTCSPGDCRQTWFGFSWTEMVRARMLGSAGSSCTVRVVK